MPSLFCLDTSVLTRLTKDSADTRFYVGIVGGRPTPLSFQVRAEALSADFVGSRHLQLVALLTKSPILQHSAETDTHYAAATRARKSLKRQQETGSDASDGDMWVIASALEHGLPLLSHDRQQIALAREVGLDTFTNLPIFRDDNPPAP